MSNTLRLAAAGAVFAVVAAVGLGLYVTRPVFGPVTSPTPGASPSNRIATPTGTPVGSAQPTSPTAGKAPFVLFLSKPAGSGTGTPNDLWAIRVDGTDLQMIFPGLGLPSVAWSQDGKRLLVNTEDVHGVSHLWAAEVADTIGEFVDTGAATGADTACNGKSGRDAPCQSAAFSFSPDGQKVVFVQSCTWSAPGCGFLSIVDLATGELTELAATLQQGRGQGFIGLPAWSPDGTEIAFILEGAPGDGPLAPPPDSNLWLIDADGTNLHQVELAVARMTAPQWSPDGTLIALMSDLYPVDSSNVRDVYTVEPDGSNLSQLTTDGASSWPEWTASGQIRFRNDNPTLTSTRFSLMDADGSNVTPLVDVQRLVGDLDPNMQVNGNIGVPGDPGRTFFWQPAD